MRSIIPVDTGLVHIIGIGGIGMSGIAEILHNLGYKVQGSDANDSPNVQRLKKLGIPVHVGQSATHLQDAAVVLMSSAIKESNPELQAARVARLPIVRRAEMLAELVRLKYSVAVAGTHGKTTTTMMIGHMLEAANFDPTIINGGIINAYGTNTRSGEGDWIVVEADESDGTFLKLLPTIAVVTNIDPEHLDHYGDFDALKAAFQHFLENVPFYGCGVVCIDHPHVQALLPLITERKVLTYGFSPQADIRADTIRIDASGSRFNILLDNRVISDVHLPMIGHHNILNALAAVAVAKQLRIDDATIRAGLAKFSGVKRRFTIVGQRNGATIIDDYGHHPVEIRAVLSTARAVCQGRLIAVIQPHRFTRLRDLWHEFAACAFDADSVILTPVYPAGEQPLQGIDSEHLAREMLALGHKDVHVLANLDDLPDAVTAHAQTGDMVVCLGAGSITAAAAGLVTSNT